MRMGIVAVLLVASASQAAPAAPTVVAAADLARAGFTQVGGTLQQGQRLFSGRLVVVDDQGRPTRAETYRQGRLDGVAEEWYADGRPKALRRYADGRRTGRHQGWWPDGRMRFVSDFADDVYHGECREWDESGRLIRLGHYRAGQEAGLQQYWRSDGTVFASYTVVNGRIYGLYGSKSCAAR